MQQKKKKRRTNIHIPASKLENNLPHNYLFKLQQLVSCVANALVVFKPQFTSLLQNRNQSAKSKHVSYSLQWK